MHYSPNPNHVIEVATRLGKSQRLRRLGAAVRRGERQAWQKEKA